VKITKITASNFRTFSTITLDVRPDLSLIIGKNNSGKTSLLVLFERFYQEANAFSFNDFPIAARKSILNITNATPAADTRIRMTIEIQYTLLDDLRFLSEFLLDLDPLKNTVNILFECIIDRKRLIAELENIDDNKERFVKKNLSQFLTRNVFAFSDISDLEEENRHRLVKKELRQVRDVINFQFIHAKRDVASSEGGKNILSKLTTQYFNRNNKAATDFDPINSLMLAMDLKLEETYKDFFEPFLNTSKTFLGIKDIKVISNLESNEILEDASQVVYGSEQDYLPENFNGLGHMNILYLLLSIEIRKESFKKLDRGINLLFIEEPEAHTHPQMQYVFANKIKLILKNIENLQAFITTHSSHIVSQCDFEDIRYLRNMDGKTELKNFHSELAKRYGDDTESFKFLEHFLTLDSCELFFANKVIFIEGITERILLPYFIEQYDQSMAVDKEYVPLSSQNITVLEVGANAKAFRHFLDLLEIKTLVITDIDTTKSTVQVNKHGEDQTVYLASQVHHGNNTSNETIKHYFSAPKIADLTFSQWFDDLKKGNLATISSYVRVAYQTEEKNYHGRSFEDAFIDLNRAIIEKKLDALEGLKNKKDFTSHANAYELTEKILDKKSAFASSLLFLALTDDAAKWMTPAYIKKGLEWISK
jgi:predicted ATP-dependent endonuclease of OLD family